MRKVLFIVLTLALAPASPHLRAQNAPSWDEKYRAIPDAAAIGQYMERLTARPRHVGAPYAKDNAEWMLARFREWGWDVNGGISFSGTFRPYITARYNKIKEYKAGGVAVGLRFGR